MFPASYLDMAGVGFALLGLTLCTGAAIYVQDHASLAVAFAIVSGLGAVFWMAPTVRRGRLRVWPARFPDPGGSVGAVNGMVVWWCVVGLVVVVASLGAWRGVEGFWFHVGAAAALLTSIRVACAYSEHGWRMLRTSR